MMEQEECQTETEKRYNGKVKWLDSEGFGYVVADDGSDEYFINPSSFSGARLKTVREGDRVEFSVKTCRFTSRSKAFDVVPVGLECYNCRRIGHYANKCPEKNKSRNKLVMSPVDPAKSSSRQLFGSGWVPLVGDESNGRRDDDDRELAGSIVCVKRREDVKKVEEIEDCFILEFDPYEVDNGSRNFEDDDDDDQSEDSDNGGEEIRSIVCVKKVEDVKKVEEVEDCFILEFDPAEPVSVKFSNLSLDASKSELVTVFEEDVAIIAEKGQVACRDYPHPRHLCARHPFKKTLYETHCEMCYCYACDIPAPCAEWTKGSMHCHATDESFVWRNLRGQKKAA